MKKQRVLRDFLYFDLEKALSIISQLEDGLTTGIEEQREENNDERNIRKYDLKIFKPEFGGVKKYKSISLENKILHHSIFKRLESLLFDNNLALNINNDLKIEDIKTNKSFELLKHNYYVLCEGWSYIEDYRRIKNIADRFNDLCKFISRCNTMDFEQTKEFQELNKQIKRLKNDIEKLNGKKKILLEKELAKKELEFDNIVRELSGLDEVPEWLLNGIKDFIDTFMANRINFRIYPYDDMPEFNIIANLKRSCFVDSDLDNLIFSYGTRPNIKLTIFGLITSLPPKDGFNFDPMTQYEVNSVNKELADEVDFEKGFRALFVAMEGFEKFVRFSRYPNITVYPIAVYRDIRTNS